MKSPPQTGTRVDAHVLEGDAVLRDIKATPAGLSSAAVAERLQRHGANRLPEARKPDALRRLLPHFHNVLIYVLLASALIALLLGHVLDASVILAVVLVNALIGFIQEGKAQKAMDAIRRMLAPTANVLRDGERRSVPAAEIVPGDIVLLEAGDRVPADIRLLKVSALQIQEAILTGESMPVEKNVLAVAADVPLGDRRCMVYSGTLVTAGQGRGVVVATGGDSEIGRISGLLETVSTLTTPLITQIGAFARWLTVFILAVAVVLLAYGHFARGYPFAEVFMVIVGLSVAAIPEGLPAVLTITLAVGVQAMAKRNAIVRRLPAIETIGSVSVICTDKTGTLTRNEMTVASAATGGKLYRIGGTSYAPYGVITSNDIVVKGGEQVALHELARAAALCNDAVLREHEGEWTVSGDPMEGALLAFAGKAGFDLAVAVRDWSRTDIVPFDPSHRFMATLHHDHEGHAFIFAKGAPETLLVMCRSQRQADGRDGPLDAADWQAIAEAISDRGQRVLAFAVKAMPATQTVLEYTDVSEMTFVGLAGLIDPPRPEAIEAVAECHSAGIRVKMITGDHPGTARAIAREIGLRNTDGVLTGVDLDAISDAALSQRVLDVDVFARTSPEHKLRLVMALQANGMTVAMTGDGVNDAPALKRADAGIAMGLTGSEAAKESAELVLADDNFASIVAAVREGRTVYDNIKKVISWTLPTNAGEAATIIVALLAGMTLPITAIQILWVNLVTAITLGIALAFEPTEENTMRRPPRSRTAPLLDGALIWHILLVSVLFLAGVYGMFEYAMLSEYTQATARTIALNTLVVMEIFHLFFIRNIYGTSLTWSAVRGTTVVWATVVLVTLAQFAVTYLPPLQAVFDTEAVSILDGFLIICAGIALFAVVEVEKQLRLRFLRWNAGRTSAES